MRRLAKPLGLLVLVTAAALVARGGSPPLVAAPPAAAPARTTLQAEASSRAATAEPLTQPSGPPPGVRLTSEGWFAPAKTERPALPKEVTRAFVIPVREEITEKTADVFERKVRRCRQSGADLIILDMDTYGGLVHAALDISRLLKVDLSDIPTVCYIRPNAASAGALISLACDRIVMTPEAKLGDCAPIVMGGKLEGTEREKIESWLRGEFRSSAERNGYPVALAVNMVSAYEVWLIRDKATRELRYVLQREHKERVSISPGVTTAPSDPSGDWELLRVAVPQGTLLTMTTSEAVEYGFVGHVVKPPPDDPYQPLRKLYNIQGELTVLSDTWSERMVEFLTSAEVTGVLIFIALVCGYIEINVPGHIIPGVIAVICILIAFGSRYLMGMANWWAIVVFGVGVVLILLEIFVLTGFGIPGILGIVCCVVGLVAMLLPYRPGPIPLPRSMIDWNIFLNGLFAMGVAFVCAVIAIFALATYLPKVPLANRLMLAPVTATPDAALTAEAPMLKVNAGDVGSLETVCRPVGKARFGEDLLDVVTEGGVIEPPARVRVLRREGNRLVVEEVT